ncbi:Phosphoglycerol transferase MdoB [Lutibacter agarilyticus]|uniref:Phosphoglycerol transferase MdoB n=1 Tax=Lutibacter agarilyticus TaxID=1109740 RepID=A0A238VIF8_9FLAO|nr:LTA synthase family protein [Lutibacter agarilyticus]SNR33968.1 Phosphoglycerol transferase MdoB [Lutibacter agarilyticus]
MKIKYSTKQLINYAYLITALIVTFCFISLFEIFTTILKGIKVPEIGVVILYKFLNDFWAGLLIGLLLFPLHWFLSIFIKKHNQLIIQILLGLVVLIQFALVKYSTTTLLNLGADLLGYSFDDITLTVSSSESMSVLYFIPFILAVSILFALNKVFTKYISSRSLVASLFILMLIFGGLKLVLSQSSEAVYQNKLYFLASDIAKYKHEQYQLNSYDLSNKNSFPLLKPFSETNDVLAPFFNIKEEKPNIVFIIVEGLGAEFVGKNEYSGFTPFLDSLIPQSLYWENFVSNAGRTFGVLPSLFASLPYGEKGFMDLQKTPSYISLISVLKANGYTTSFYTGDPSSFDRKINFLEYNNIDVIIDEEKFGPDFEKTKANAGGFSWGYPDAEIFKKVASVLNPEKQPRLDIIMTLTNHEPFDFPSKEIFNIKVDSILNAKNSSTDFKDEVKSYEAIFASILYTDTAIKNFITNYKKRPEFANTIFVITGDHRLIPINQKDKLCRFHVPFLIYSPLLNKTKSVKSISSHLDVTPTLLSFLMNNYSFNKLEKTAWLSEGLDTVKEFRNIHKIPLMRYKGSINDYIYNDYMLSDGALYQINENFGINKVIEKELIKSISDSLLEFKKLNRYVIQKNRIFPDSLNIYRNSVIEFSEGELQIIRKLTRNLNFDECFNLAKETAFNKDYIKARLLCNYILNELPNHADARTLKGRTLAWDEKFEEAEKELLSVVKRSPFYYDSYLALLDLYWWSNQHEKSIEITQKAFDNKLENSDISFKLAKAYTRMDSNDEAKQIMDSLVKIYPDNIEYITFNKSLK